MFFNVFLIIIILFIIFNFVFDIQKIYNTGSFNLIEGFQGAYESSNISAGNHDQIIVKL